MQRMNLQHGLFANFKEKHSIGRVGRSNENTHSWHFVSWKKFFRKIFLRKHFFSFKYFLTYIT